MDVIEVNGIRYRLSKHAVHRANKRNITIEEIYDALYNPKNIRRTQVKGKEDSYTFYGRNGINVITNLDKTLIITVLRRSISYARSRAKQTKNKRQVKNKKLYGNRAKK